MNPAVWPTGLEAKSRVAAPGAALLPALWLVQLVAGGCAPSSVARRIASVAEITESAGRAGARRCAPEELALARVHLEFARLELDQGEPGLADRHLTLAEPNAKAALRLSAADESCAHAPSHAAHRARSAGASELLPPRSAQPTDLLASHRARFDSSSRLLGAVGDSRDIGRGAP